MLADHPLICQQITPWSASRSPPDMLADQGWACSSAIGKSAGGREVHANSDFVWQGGYHSPLNVDDSVLWILYMLKQLLSSSPMEFMEPGCPGNVESGETRLLLLYPRCIGSQYTGVHPCSCKSQSLPAPDTHLTNTDSRTPCNTCITRWVGRGRVGR